MKKLLTISLVALTLSSAVLPVVVTAEKSGTTTVTTLTKALTDKDVKDTQTFNDYFTQKTTQFIDQLNKEVLGLENLETVHDEETLKHMTHFYQYLVDQKQLPENKLIQLTTDLTTLEMLTPYSEVATEDIESLNNMVLNYLALFDKLLYADEKKETLTSWIDRYKLHSLITASRLIQVDALTDAQKIQYDTLIPSLEAARAMSEIVFLLDNSFDSEQVKSEFEWENFLTNYQKVQDKNIFLKQYDTKIEALLAESRLRQEATEAVKIVEEKKARGEVVSSEEQARADKAIAVVTPTVKEAIQATVKVAITPPKTETPQSTPVAEQPTLAVTAPSQPVVEQPKSEMSKSSTESLMHAIPEGFFSTFDEAISFGESQLNGLDKASFQAYTAGVLPNGIAYYGVDFYGADTIN